MVITWVRLEWRTPVVLLYVASVLGCLLLRPVQLPGFNIYYGSLLTVSGPILIAGIVSAAVLDVVIKPHQFLFASARDLHWYRGIFASCAVLVPTVLWLFIPPIFSVEALQGARNLAALVGIGLVCRRLGGAATAMAVPIIYLGLTILFGDRGTFYWDWLMDTEVSPQHAFLSVFLLLTGITVGLGGAADRYAVQVSGGD